jgi:hypothetical protein
VAHALVTPDEPAGWPGMFRPLLHYVPQGSRRYALRGYVMVLSFCGSLCPWPACVASQLKWCLDCRARLNWEARTHDDHRPTVPLFERASLDLAYGPRPSSPAWGVIHDEVCSWK